MSVHIHVLFASPKFRPHAKRLRVIAQKAVHLVQRRLPLKDIDIVLYENPDDVVSEVGGVGGFTPHAHIVLISLDPANPKFKASMEGEVTRALIHELHHAIRWRKPGYGETLLEALITEGLADQFVLELTGDQKPEPWARALKPAERTRLLARAKKVFHKPYNHFAWFFGSKEEKLPRWTGYSLGFFLVGEYLKAHPDETPSQLVATEASVFISRD